MYGLDRGKADTVTASGFPANPFVVASVTPMVRRSPTLAEFRRREMYEAGLQSSYQLADALGVAQGTANRLLNSSRIPREETLARIARWTDVPITDVRKMAERAVGEPEPFRVPREFDQLGARERAVLIEMGWTLLEAHAERVTR